MNFKLIIETDDLSDLNEILRKIDEQQKPNVDPIHQLEPREILFGEDPYRVCECGCGKHFIPKRADSRFYSKKCAQKVYYRNFLNREKKKYLKRS